MSDLSKTVAPKSDQLNFDDFPAGKTKTIVITDVKVTTGDQPAAIHYEGDAGKPWKPCKSMRRVLMAAWGSDGQTYRGRMVTLYGDPEVKFGGDKVGGIRISHMSHIPHALYLPLTVTRGSRKPYKVEVLTVSQAAPAPTIDIATLKNTGEEAAKKGMEQLKAWWTGLGGEKQQAIGGAAYLDELKKVAGGSATVTV